MYSTVMNHADIQQRQHVQAIQRYCYYTITTKYSITPPACLPPRPCAAALRTGRNIQPPELPPPPLPSGETRRGSGEKEKPVTTSSQGQG
ncbi:hypothetical protein VFPFJ_05121 [Purpureocillium lilacinum]|uniref:Uncharacterized protein n=1 Tax=Purpureocillium lilacinum TaxID=33203 RepID=A0A179HM70_PURLI|nr:hypothetical protein VFPFJ_05121 [Purpureocillium lilacinum]OAQ90962.1 hypothetical protein VFPFJ_05121 [Purpureocillium lilacinum]